MAGGSHTLGCAIITRRCRGSACTVTTRIHLLRVDRAGLRDVVYVSAAHEMLHAAYAKMGDDDRRQLDRELESAVATLDRCKVAVNFATYLNGPPEQRANELHSLLGTQIARLPRALETHYRQYFFNRQLVVGAHDRTLGHREDTICRLRAGVDKLEAEIAATGDQLERLRAAGDIEAFNRQLGRHNALVRDHNRLVSDHNRTIDEYNAILRSLGSSVDPVAPRKPAQNVP